MPDRIQRRRQKGWRKPAGVVDVTRVGRWGNPFVVAEDTSGWWVMTDAENGHWHTTPRDAAVTAVRLFRDGIDEEQRAIIREHLRGRDLMCFCALCPAHADGRPHTITCADCAPCHADVLLAIANG